jgi:hypothetical protein
MSFCDTKSGNFPSVPVKAYVRKAATAMDPDGRLFSMHELKFALRKLRRNKAPGIDGIYNEFLINSSKPIRCEILELANLIWLTGEMPSSFLCSVIIPILKPDKPPEETRSYRPVALTSCLSKLIEHLVVHRLTY